MPFATAKYDLPVPAGPKPKTKSKSKKEDPKVIIEGLKNLPGIGAKSAKAFYEAGFKTTKSIISAKDEDLLAIPGVGINLVKNPDIKDIYNGLNFSRSLLENKFFIYTCSI